MTIIAGFKCQEGIVICSDTQESVEGSPAKRHVPKLRFEPAGEPHNTDDVAVAFCGSGHGPFIDKLVENAWEDAQSGTNIDDVAEDIEKSIKSAYENYGRIYQAGYCPSAELIYGIKMHGTTRMFMAHGPIVNRKDKYETSGVGYYLADFLAAKMYREHLNLHQCVILAAYILFQAKEHVEGCGGESHIAVLRDNGVSGLVSARHVDEMTTILKFADYHTGEILLSTANFGIDLSTYTGRLNSIVEALTMIRTTRKQEFDRMLAYWEGFEEGLSGVKPGPIDALGLPKPSDSQKV